MLVGTFQGIPDASHGWVEGTKERLSSTPEAELDEGERLWLPLLRDHRSGERAFGFSPVWFFPMPTLADAFAHAAMTAPFSTMFFLAYDIPEGEFIKLDAREHENHPESLLDDWHLLETDSDDGSILEYVIDDRKLDDYSCWCCSPFVLRQDRYLFHGLSLPDEAIDAYEWLNEPLFAYFDRVPGSGASYAVSVVNRTGASDEVVRESMFRQQLVKDEFLFARLPLVFSQLQAFVTSRPVAVNTAYFAAISRDMDKFQRLRLRFLDMVGSSESISYSDWRGVYDGFKGMVCENVDVLKELCERGEPRRNDPCPCGSGRKWKQCHGRLHHEVRCKSSV